MLKYTFLIYHQDYISFLEEIRKAGVIHIKEKSEGIVENELISDSIKKVQQLREKIKILKARKIGLSTNESNSDASEIVTRISYLQLQLELKKNELQTIAKETQLLNPWGEFSWDTISKLKESGNFLHF
ncbi:MAG: hypothetical protein PF541_05215, partial [Prolixibacteraceae bacterium]|nr:hypothetical protein [Prolixibacteraceae bacterium]